MHYAALGTDHGAHDDRENQPTDVRVDADGGATADAQAEPLQPPERKCADYDPRQCPNIARRGDCSSSRYARFYCAKSCNACNEFEAAARASWLPELKDHSLADYYFEPFLAKNKECSASARLLRASRCDTHDLEDERRMADRGYFVHRGAISEEDLERMDGFVAKVPNPKRLMCGASDVQPGECMLNGAAHVKRLAPSLAEAVSSRLKNWTSSGLGQTAGLGYPLTFDGGEFIQINRWPFANNASCVLSDLFAAAADFLEPECAGETDSLSHGWLQCYFHAIVHAMPIAQTRSILAAATQPGATCLTQRPRFLEGAIEYVMGGDGFFDFGPTGVVERHRGTRRLLSNLKAWLTQETNFSAYQGWHDWHADGPSDYGRYHKAYAIVSKGASKSGSVVRERTNVALVNAQVLYAHADCFFKLMGDERTRLQSLSDKEMAPEIQRIQPSMGRPWGLNHLVSNYEGLGCAIALDPGDVLFFREDVWHRTQDMDADRVAIILDVLRFPLPSVPSKMPAFKRRPPQWQMLELHHRLPREAQEAGQLWWHSEKKEESECMCGDAERVECLPSRGYVVARQVLGPAALEAVFAGFGALPVDKVEAQGRVYSPSIGLADLRRMSPSFVESLYALLDSWHEKRLLPPTFSPPVFVRDARGNGSATRSSTPPGSFRIDNAQFVSADPALQRQVGCPECETLECQAKMCPSNFDWHIDGSGPRGEGYHKLWVPIRKAVREHANVMLAPSTGLEAMSDAALRALPGEPTLASAGPSGSRDAYERGWQRVLSDVGCTVELDAGDVLFFEADVYHRTQDLLADRTALLIGLSTIA